MKTPGPAGACSASSSRWSGLASNRRNCDSSCAIREASAGSPARPRICQAAGPTGGSSEGVGSGVIRAVSSYRPAPVGRSSTLPTSAGRSETMCGRAGGTRELSGLTRAGAAALRRRPRPPRRPRRRLPRGDVGSASAPPVCTAPASGRFSVCSATGSLESSEGLVPTLVPNGDAGTCSSGAGVDQIGVDLEAPRRAKASSALVFHSARRKRSAAAL